MISYRGIVNAIALQLWCAYFRPRIWEADGRVYGALGVRRAKELFFGGRYFNALIGALRGRTYRPFSGKGWPQEWMRFTVFVELGHTFIGLYMLADAMGAVMRDDWQSALTTLAINIVINVYPVMIQRYNRARLVRVFDLDTTEGLTMKRWIAGLQQ